MIAGLERPRQLESVYYDTPSLDLKARGLSLRVRSSSAGKVQTVKALGAQSGLFVRAELETLLSCDGPDPLASPEVGAVLAGRPGVALAPLFEVKVERAAGLVKDRRGEVEVCLDLGAIQCADRSAPLIEIELELKRGRPGRLFQLAETLFVAAPLRLSALSKAEAGYELVEGPRPAKTAPVDLSRQTSAASALQQIGRACLAQYLRNERLVRAHGSAEAVHQARVGIRRLRAAMSIFRALIADSQSQALRSRLRGLAGQLAPARDLDALIAGLPKARGAGATDLAALRAALETRRREAYAEVGRVLAGPEAGRLAFDVAAWLETGWWLTTQSGEQAARRTRPVTDLAREALDRRTRRLTKRSRDFKALTPAERHEVRKAAKKLRYGAEFFQSLARKGDRARAKAFVEALKPLQEALGELNDAEVAREILVEVGRKADPASRRAAQVVIARIARGDASRLRQAAKAARAFAAADGFL